MTDKQTSTNQSVQKTLQIIEVMAHEQKPMKLSDIAARCDLPPSTALRMVNTLVTFGYATQWEDTLCYSLSLKFAHIGKLVIESSSLYRVAHPHLEKLALRCKVNANITVCDKKEALYVDVVDGSDSPLKVTHAIGQKFPLYATASGKILLGAMASDKLEEYLEECNFESFTPRTICTAQELKEHVKKCREQGYSYNDEETCLGMRCLAVPIVGYDGKVAAGLSLSGTIYQMSYEYMNTLLPIVKQTAETISQGLSYPFESIVNI